MMLLSCIPCFGQTPEDSVAIVNTQWQTREVAKGVTAMSIWYPELFGGSQHVYMVEVKGRKIEYLDHDGEVLTSRMATAADAVAAINGGRYDSVCDDVKTARSCMAQKGKRYYLIVVDGLKENESIGMTLDELNYFLKVMKLENAVLLEGGESSVLWTQPRVRFYNDGTPVCPCNGILNVPGADGYEKTVTSSYVVK